jgi:hypothetical protein
MGVRMRHPDLEAEITAPPSAVPFHAAAGWVEVEGQDETGDVWPAELQPFEGQEQVRLRHPDLDGEVTVARSAVAVHAANGWYEAEPAEVAPDQAEAGSADDLDSLTVADLQDHLRARDLPVSGTKAELIERLRAGTEEEAEPAGVADDESEA